MDAWLSIAILAIVMVLLISGRARIDLVGVVALVLVGLFHLVPTIQLFSGFSSYAAIILAEMFILGEALKRSGATDVMAAWFEKIGNKGEGPLINALMLAPPIPSTFISDVGLMSIFLPTMVRIRQHLKISLHRLLMPLVVAIALGGLLSMIGSAGNIIGNATLAQNHYRPIPLFAITPLGVVLVLAGFLFMKWWGVHRLPQGDPTNEFLTDYQEVKDFMSEIRVSPSSPLVGRKLKDVAYLRQHHITVVRIFRSSGPAITPGAQDQLMANDRLLVQGDMQAIVDLTPEDGLDVLGADHASVRLRNEHIRVVEAMVPQRSVLVHHTLRETDFRARYGPTVLAVLRQGVTRMRALPELVIESGDVLLVMGSDDAIGRLQMSDDLIVFSNLEKSQESRSKHSAIIATGVVVGVLLVAAFNFLAIQVAAAAGIGILVLTRILTLDRAYRAIDWRIITLVGGITPLSLALTDTGVTAGLSHTLLHLVGAYGPYAVLAVFFWLAAILTQVISNVAAALVLAPLAITVASTNHWSPYPLIITMIVALSAAPITPLANKVFIMAMDPGGYRYRDFFRIGLPLTIVMFILTLAMAPALFPFSAHLAPLAG